MAGGTIIRNAGKPVVGVWLMPDNTLPGNVSPNTLAKSAACSGDRYRGLSPRSSR